MIKKLVQGYLCKCGTNHKFPTYVYAHWNITINHTCETCGRVNTVLRGHVKFGQATKKSSECDLSGL